MKLLPLATAALLTASSPGQTALPAWNGSERKDLEALGWVAGDVLLTGDPVEPAQFEQPLPDELVEAPTALVEVAEKFLPAYFAERPANFLIDPQNLLSATDFQERLNFLNEHAAESSIDLFVYVFGGDQQIPAGVRTEEMMERFFSEGRPAAMVFYHLGAPQRAAVHLSPALAGSISQAEQNRALEGAVMQAFEKTQPPEQLDKFLIQMSIRLYWMERVLGGVASPEVVRAARPETKDRAAGKFEKFRVYQVIALRWMTPAGILLGSVLLACGIHRWMMLRARYRFPDFEVEPRLGGAHAAGIGAVISFASAAIPPASQRDQVPDYLRRA